MCGRSDSNTNTRRQAAPTGCVWKFARFLIIATKSCLLLLWQRHGSTWAMHQRRATSMSVGQMKGKLISLDKFKLFCCLFHVGSRDSGSGLWDRVRVQDSKQKSESTRWKLEIGIASNFFPPRQRLKTNIKMSHWLPSACRTARKRARERRREGAAWPANG